jgi:hypothetical protein
MIAVDDANATIAVVPSPNKPGSMITMQFAGGRHVLPLAGPELPGKVNYIRGNDPEKWKIGLPTYGRVAYRNVYPGVDVVYYGNQQQLEFDLVLKPGADSRSIRMKFEGARKISLDPNGDLVLDTASGEMRLPSPRIYQETNGTEAKKTIAGHYRRRPGGEVGFEVAAYDRTSPLIIDPTIAFAAVFGGSGGATVAQAIALDSMNNIYVAGSTYSADFPTTSGTAQPGYDANQDGFVLEMNATGTEVIYSTYLGGALWDSLASIALDSTGAAWVTGTTASSDFPTVNAYQNTLNGLGATVVAKLSSSGTLEFSTFFTSAYSYGQGIAVDASDNAYVTGYGWVPTTPGALLTPPSVTNAHAFVAKFTSSGSLVYSTLLGGDGADGGQAIAADSSGNAYVTGSTNSSDFTGDPGGGAQTINAGQNAFVAKLNPSGNALVYFTFLGGSGTDGGSTIAVDSSSPPNAYIGGTTFSINFPVTTGVVQTTLAGEYNGFVAKLNGTGSAFSYVTYLGGNRSDYLQSLAVDPSSGDVYVAGYTNSSTFPSVSPVEGFPSNPTTLFQTTSGTSWSAFDTNIPGVVISISPDPVHFATVVVSTDAGIYRTTNHGSKWTLQFASSPPFPLGASLSRSPANPSTLYAVENGYSQVSTDNGVTWNSPEPVGASVNVLVADPLSAGTAYAYAGSTSGIYKTTNSGSTWTLLIGTPFLPVSMAAAPNGTLYITGAHGVYQSADQGATWTPINTGLPSFSNSGLGTVLSVSPGASGNVLYLSYNGALYKTTNGGASWFPTAASVPNGAFYVASSPNNPNFVYAASPVSPVLYLSSDGGTTWNPAATGIGIASITSVVFNPHSSTHAYALASVNYAGFVAKLNSTATSLVYSSYLGGSGTTEANGIATNGQGEAFVTGYTNGLPIASALPGSPTSTDAFVVAISDATEPCTYSIFPNSQTIETSLQSPAATVTFGVNAPSGCSWRAVSNQPWATVTGGASGTGAGVVTVQATANTTRAIRSASIAINTGTATLIQSPSSCTYNLSAYAIAFSNAGGPGGVSVTTNFPDCPWTVVDNDPSAVVDVNPTSETGNGSLTFSVLPNAGLNPRSLSLSIAGAALNITESGVCTFSIDSPSFQAPAAGGVGAVSVTASAGGCVWGASSQVDWLTIISVPVSGSGSGAVDYLIGANTGAARSGTMNIAGQTFTVYQAAGAISPASVSPAAGSALAQTFTFTFDDPNGYADLAVVNVLINSSLDGMGACYVAFAPSNATSGYLYLVDDAGDGGYAGGSPMALPSNGTLQNSQCAINGIGSSVSASGTTLTLTLAIGFNASFAGNQIIYMAASSNSQNSGWQPLGTWNVPGTAPVGPAVGGLSPARSATTGQTYSFTFTDTNGYEDLAAMNVLINNSMNGIGACYLAFVPTSATTGYLYLVDDAGDGGYASGSPIALPSSSTIQNSQCTINGTGSSASASGNTLTLNLAMTFSSSFAGNQVFYLAARNNSSGNSGWQPVGSVTVP